MSSSFVELPYSRLPVPVEWHGMSHFFLWGTNRTAFVRLLDELRTNPPLFVFAEGYHGQVQNPIQWGPIVGSADPAYGEFFTPGIGDYLSRGLADPELIRRRWVELDRYLREMQAVTRPAPYADLGTQLYGNPTARLGFWEFWDNWARYETVLGLGARPPEPSTWRRRWHDAAGWDIPTSSLAAYSSEELEMLRGLRFPYSPKKCLYCHPDDSYCERDATGTIITNPGQPCRYHRYAVCLNTVGWMEWWKILIQKLASVGFGIAFIDNCVAPDCYGPECQGGYAAWLEGHYSPRDRERFFVETTSLLPNHSFERPWAREAPDGDWTAIAVAAENGARIYPDVDSVGGLYSCRLEGPGLLRWYTYPPFGVSPTRHDYDLTIHYRTIRQGSAALVVREETAGNPVLVSEPLPQSNRWRQHRCRFSSDHTVTVMIRLTDAGTLLIDEAWLSALDDPSLGHPQFDGGLVVNRPEAPAGQYGLRVSAASEYFEHVLDERLVALRRWAREVDPHFELLTNSFHERQGSDHYTVEHHGNFFSNQHGRLDVGHPPGLYRPGFIIDGAGEYRERRLHAPQGELLEQTVTDEVVNDNLVDYRWATSKRDPAVNACHIQLFKGHLDYLHNDASAMLCCAEGTAFGGGAGIDLEVQQPDYRRSYTEAGTFDRIRLIGQKFFDFVTTHAILFEGLQPHSDVGIVADGLRYDANLTYRNQITDLCRSLSSRGVLWEMLTFERLNHCNIRRLKAVVLHGVERLSVAVSHALVSHMECGATVVASGTEPWRDDGFGRYDRFSVGKFDEHWRLHAAHPKPAWPPVPLSGSAVEVWPVGSGQLVNVPDGALDVDQIVHYIETGPGFDRQRKLGIVRGVDPSLLERLRVAAWHNADRFVLHLLNYNVAIGIDEADPVQPVDTFEVQLELPNTDHRPSRVVHHSPDLAGWNEPADFHFGGQLISITLPGLHVYQLIELNW